MPRGLSSRTASDIAKNNTLGAKTSILIRAYRVLPQKPQPTIQPTRYCTVFVPTPSAIRYSPCAARVSSLGYRRRHRAAEPDARPALALFTRSHAPSHPATKCHARVRHSRITVEPSRRVQFAAICAASWARSRLDCRARKSAKDGPYCESSRRARSCQSRRSLAQMRRAKAGPRHKGQGRLV
jgi:hypothetical protein